MGSPKDKKGSISLGVDKAKGTKAPECQTHEEANVFSIREFKIDEQQLERTIY